MTSRTTRQTRVVDLLRAHDVRSQGELLSLLSRDGVEVTQATLSRDLVEVGAVKVRKGRQLVYALPDAGGAVASAEVTAPGFRSDLFSAFYPLAAASPVLQRLDLGAHGLAWSRAPAVLTHVLPDGRSATLWQDPARTASSLAAFDAADGDAGSVRVHPAGDGGGGLRLPGHVEHQQHRQAQPLRQVRRRAGAAGRGRDAVEQAHRRLHHQHRRPLGRPRGQRVEQRGRHGPTVQVDPRRPGGCSML